MGKFKVILKPSAEKDIRKHKKSGNKAIIRKITKIVGDLETHPYTGVGKPEKLKNDLSGLWSRRINKKDRLVYEVNDNIVTVYVLSAMGHYDDK